MLARYLIALLLVVSQVLPCLSTHSHTTRSTALAAVLDMNIDGGAVSFMESIVGSHRGSLIILVLNSYGGYLSSADRIISLIESSGSECIAWIPPSGYAISAAAYIALSCSKIYMGEGSVIGGIKPSPDDPKTVEYVKARLTAFMERKKVPDASAIATDLVERARTFTAEEAEKIGLAVVASSVDEIAKKENLEITGYFEPSLWDRTISLISHPLVSQLMLFAGFLLILIEIFTTGFQGYGVAGALMILIALYGMTMIRVEILYVGLVLAGAVLLSVEVLTPGFGAFGLTGIMLTATGLILTLMRTPGETLTSLVLSTAVGISMIAGLFVFIGIKAAKTMRMRRSSLRDQLIGSVGIAKTDLTETTPGTVYVLNEDWTAFSIRDRIPAGSKVRVVRVDGLKIYVEREQDQSP